MRANPSLRTMGAPARRVSRVVAAVSAGAGCLVVGDSAALADQTVFFEEAGDAPHISLIGDSTLSGVRWYDDYGDLEQFNFVFSAESCRRTVERSCFSREGYRAANAVSAMQTLEGKLGEVLVVMNGYNDPPSSIDEAIAAVVDEARAQGVGHVVWLTLRTSEDVDYSDPLHESNVNTFHEYNRQLYEAANTSDGYFQVADWATYSADASEWLEGDGVHLTPEGVDAVTSFIAENVERVLAGEVVTPPAPPWTDLRPGAVGETVERVQEALIAAGVELPGGADGLFGRSTTDAVSEFQRRNTLVETGTVNVATARALGVYQDPAESTTTTAAATSLPTGAQDVASTTVTSTPATAARAVTPPLTVPSAATTTSPPLAESVEDGDALVRSGLFITAAAVVVLGAVIVRRRRHITAGRETLRWARVPAPHDPEHEEQAIEHADVSSHTPG